MDESHRSAPRVVLYMRQGCHLCDVARKALEAEKLQPTCVDIDGDLELSKQLNDCVPVVEIDGKIRFRGRVDQILLQRLLRNYG